MNLVRFVLPWFVFFTIPAFPIHSGLCIIRSNDSGVSIGLCIAWSPPKPPEKSDSRAAGSLPVPYCHTGWFCFRGPLPRNTSNLPVS
ncbi:hypothetical protein B9Z19DRAFT_1094743 [Tuber borchii]|uniref:Secreted protein n=1 Tax=Tuber borchii TaxID=42251 RepID=A0A2T6ZDR7_TUBBO|nr:hypothetical protein B9Z19DRAFT_1094743 [Tuber borchii]